MVGIPHHQLADKCKLLFYQTSKYITLLTPQLHSYCICPTLGMVKNESVFKLLLSYYS